MTVPDRAAAELRYWATVGPARDRTVGGWALAVLAELDAARARVAALEAVAEAARTLVTDTMADDPWGHALRAALDAVPAAETGSGEK